MPRHARPPTAAERAWADQWMKDDTARMRSEATAAGEHWSDGSCWCQPTYEEFPNGARMYVHRRLADKADDD